MFQRHWLSLFGSLLKPLCLLTLTLGTALLTKHYVVLVLGLPFIMHILWRVVEWKAFHLTLGEDTITVQQLTSYGMDEQFLPVVGPKGIRLLQGLTIARLLNYGSVRLDTLEGSRQFDYIANFDTLRHHVGLTRKQD